MSDTPEGGFTLEWIGRAILGLQQDIRGVKDEVRGLNDRLAGVEIEQRDLRERFNVFETRVSAALFRVDAQWRETREEVKGLRVACEQVLHHLRAGQPH